MWDLHGQLTKMLSGPKDMEGVHFDTHPTRPMLACVTRSGALYIYTKAFSENWSAFAPDFKELEENEEVRNSLRNFSTELFYGTCPRNLSSELVHGTCLRNLSTEADSTHSGSHIGTPPTDTPMLVVYVPVLHVSEHLLLS